MPVDPEAVVAVLKKCYDPEIPIDIYNLGLIYKMEVKEDGTVDIDMALTSPFCPVGPAMMAEVRSKVLKVAGVKDAKVTLVAEPAWEPKRATEEGRMQLELMGIRVPVPDPS